MSKPNSAFKHECSCTVYHELTNDGLVTNAAVLSNEPKTSFVNHSTLITSRFCKHDPVVPLTPSHGMLFAHCLALLYVTA